MSERAGTPSDIVVIGAGIQGLSAAYHLALNRRASVTVLERNPTHGMESSGRSGSMLMKSRENSEKIALSLYSYDRLMKFADEFNESLTFRKTGFLSVVPPKLAERYNREHELRLRMGAPSKLLSAAEIEEIAPGVNVSGIEFGVLGEDDGEIDARQIMRAYERHARRLGVTFHYDATVTDIEIRHSRIVAVHTGNRYISCGTAVLAAGAASRRFGDMLGLELPIANARRSIYFGTSADARYQTGPMVEDAQLEWYYRGLGSNEVLIGMGKESDGQPGDSPNMELLPEVRRVAAHRAPGLAEFNLTRGVSGIRPLTPDILPILGKVTGIDGLVLSCGWGGEGIMHSPAGGALVADTVFDTETCPIDKGGFMLSRFAASLHHG